MRIYRGKTKQNDEWVYGYAFCINDKKYVNTVEFDVNCETKLHQYFKTNEVIADSVGQCSTVKDKNGVDMFEGDIVAGALSWLEHKKYGIVVFREGSFGLLWYRGKAEQFNPFTSMCNVWYEVVGNIFDNPELLEV